MSGAEPSPATAVKLNHQASGQQATQDAGRSRKVRNVAAIDVGTNSTHMLVASVDVALGTFSIDLAEKSNTRLGERDPDTGELTPEAMARGLESLRHFRELAVSHQVEQVVVAATSAVREAPNGRDFLQRIKDELDLDVDLVSGPEEARLIYLGV